jgi:hypothetical protein
MNSVRYCKRMETACMCQGNFIFTLIINTFPIIHQILGKYTQGIHIVLVASRRELHTDWWCQYPVDQVPIYTSFKSRQVAGRVSTHCHVSYGSGSHLPAEMGAGVATCHMASDLASRLRWASALPRAPRLRTSPLG